ncbi:MAG: LuxR C-terminal-related transcriptional regulator [Thermoleophilia bacterium]
MDLTRADAEERLIVICADAGYGKTTLMGQINAEYGGHSIWYQLSSEDNDMTFFLANLLEGMRWTKPDFGEVVGMALSQSSDVGRDRENLLTLFITEMNEKITEPSAFCFDEFHLVNDNELLIGSIEFLFKHMPSNCRMIISSREKPAFHVGRLRTHRAVLEIGMEELRFTYEETAQLMDGCCNPPLDKDELKAWHTKTEGWPVALVLSRNALDADHRLPDEVFPELLGTSGAMAEYLAEEIWSGLDESMRRFLMSTSLLEIVDVDICDRALSAQNQGIPSVKFLKQMEERNLMTDCLETGKNYRYHQLVRQFLNAKLDQNSTLAEIAELYQRFGQAYAAAGDYNLAIKHFLDAGHPESAADVLEASGQDMLIAGGNETIARWLACLPTEMLISRPWLIYLSARASERMNELENAGRQYIQAEDAFRKINDTHGLYVNAKSMAEFYFFTEQHVKSVKKATQAYGWADSASEKVVALSRIATEQILLGDTAEAMRLLNQAADLCDDSMVLTRTSLSVEALNPKWFCGDFRGVLQDILRLQEVLEPETAAIARFQVLFLKVMTLYETGEYQKALDALREKEDYLGTEDHLTNRCFEMIEGVIRLCLKNGRKGQQLIEDVIANADASMVIGPGFGLNYLGSWHRRRKELDAAIAANAQALEFSRESGKQYSIASCLVNLGADKLRQNWDSGAGEPAEFSEALALAERCGYQFIITQVHFHRAWMAFRAGARDTALSEITVALETASRFERTSFIVQEGRISLELLAFAFEQDIKRDYLTRVYKLIGAAALPSMASLLKSGNPASRIAAVTAMGTAGGAKAAPYIRRALRDQDVTVRRAANAELRRLRSSIDSPEKILTRRENQVMELIAEGMSNAEIAERLYISEPTAKTHISRIFRKLGLTSRSQVAVLFQKNNRRVGDSGAGKDSEN